MKKLHISSFLFLLLIPLLIVNCKKDEAIIEPGIVKEATVPNKFIWNGLHDFYLWVDQVPKLSDPKYSKNDTLNALLNSYNDPEDLFYDLLYKYQEIDKWSFIVEDLKIIEDWIAGISKTTGMDFDLRRIGSSNNVFGFVRYVQKGSPADLAGVKRGDIFIKVDDQQLTVSNYQNLLFTKESFKLSFADLVNFSVVPNNRSVNLTSVEMQENPIYMDTVLNVNGSKVGYLVYNGFNSEFDIQLNQVIGEFKSEGISKLILDLRYNGGGSVQTAIYLASMIYSTDKTKVFSKSQYNDLLQDYFVDRFGEAALVDNFTDKIEKTAETPETQINSLGLNTLYIITTDNTASASELLLNGLDPYLTVKSVGTATVGKYVGSITIQDEDENGKVNPANSWAMQPIVVKITNSQGVSDYVNGLSPDIYVEEDIASLLPFGNPEERLLKAALNDIKGLPQQTSALKSAALRLKKIADSKDFKPFSKDMYVSPKFSLPSTLKTGTER